MTGEAKRFIARLRNLLRPARAERELNREVASHLAIMANDLERRGLSPQAAADAARRSFGGIDQAKERQRDERSFLWLEDLRRDLRYALHGLAKNPLFTSVAIFTVALGVGANTAIFSVVNAVLLNPLPFKNPDRLVSVYENVPAAESPTRSPRRLPGVDVREFIELRSRSRTLSDVTTTAMALVSIAGAADTVPRELTSVSSGAFPMLGIPPLMGRWLGAEDELPGNDTVIVLSYNAWQRYFAGDPKVLGRTLAFNANAFTQGATLGSQYTVVGVMPRGFRFPSDGTDFWIPLAVRPPGDARPRRVWLMARLADGMSPAAAADEVRVVARDLRGPDKRDALDVSAPQRFEVVPVRDEVGASVKPALLILTGAVGVVLLIACVNVANLLLARTATRERELAIRVAIGAGRGRLIRQLLTESLLLSLMGGALGTLFAAGGVRLFRALATGLARKDVQSIGNSFPRIDAISINGPVFAFSIAVSAAAGLLFGVVPALRYARRAHMDVLRSALGSTSASGGSGGRRRLQAVLVVAEITLATILFVGSGLLIHSFANLVRVNPGYDPSNVLTFQVSLPGADRSPVELKQIAENLTSRLRSAPGVRFTAYTDLLPTVALQNSMALRTTPELPTPGAPPRGGDVRLVSSDYLRTLGIRVVAGRGFNENDGPGRPHVLLVNRTLARRDLGGNDAVGTMVYAGRDSAPWEIVGIVDDVHQAGLDQEAKPQIFVNIQQWSRPDVPIFPIGPYYAIRTTGNPIAAIPHVRDAVLQIDGQASIENIATMEQLLANTLMRPRMYATLLGLFASLAVGLAAAGIYGVMSYAVTERTRELGLRMALGARRGQVRALVMGQTGILTAMGIGLGLAGAMATTKYLETLLFGLTALDASTFAAVSLLFAAVATVAALIPANRATRVNPLVALRQE